MLSCILVPLFYPLPPEQQKHVMRFAFDIDAVVVFILATPSKKFRDASKHVRVNAKQKPDETNCFLYAFENVCWNIPCCNINKLLSWPNGRQSILAHSLKKASARHNSSGTSNNERKPWWRRRWRWQQQILHIEYITVVGRYLWRLKSPTTDKMPNDFMTLKCSHF